MTVLVCAAHPDDEVIGVGGTIAKLSKDEDVIVIIFSYGVSFAGRASSIPPLMSYKKLISVRVKESQKAGEILGVKKTYFLGIKEWIPKEFTPAHKEIIKSIIKKYAPHKIFFHSKKDGHPDHLAVNKVMNEIVSALKKKPEILTYQVSTFDFSKKDPSIIYDISKEYKTKMRALDAFKSQVIWTWPLKSVLTIKGVFFGQESRTIFAEYFYTE